MEIYLYTDGACSGNPGAGGFGFVVTNNSKKPLLKHNQGYKKTTNNRMELMAVISGVASVLKSLKTKDDYVIHIFSDSKYIVDAFQKKWIKGWLTRDFRNAKGESVKNVDLWIRLLVLLLRATFTINWVKGHDTDYLNNLADELAVTARENTVSYIEDSFYLEGRTEFTALNETDKEMYYEYKPLLIKMFG